MKYQKNGIFVSCPQEEAVAVVSSNQSFIYQIIQGSFGRAERFVEMIEITESEYNDLSDTYPDKTNKYGVPDDTYHAIIDDYTEELLGGEL